ncbi:heavy metal-binding domain-containing protein [Geomonas agri]|uniref:heavy metal-binding domain-containing protein n=1 Tax=Geomonas agri TaxID=2873702 RepID=UPI001CD1DDF5|nr:heavy metal-binding domain-containing protein [Geomonas agri]
MSETSQSLYKKAYDAHYKECDYGKALPSYNAVIEEFPDSAEATYARTQLENLENSKDKLNKQRIKSAEAPPESFYEPAVILTTAPWLEGYRVKETVEVITSECVLGIDFISDFIAKITDVVGGRSGITQNALRNARKACLSELRQEAGKLGANAVIAVTLNYNEFSGQGKSMLFLVASGTAVKVEKMAD